MAKRSIDDVSWTSAFSSDGKLDWSSEVKIPELDLDSALTLMQAITKEAENFQKKVADGDTIIKALLEDQIAENKKLFDQYLKYEVQIAKIEGQIKTAKEKGDVKELKHLNQRLKIVKEARDVESKTQAIVNAYQEDIDARNQLRKAQQEAQKAGKDLLSEGLKTGSLKEIFDGFKLSLTGGLSGGSAVLKSLDTIASGIGSLSKKLDRTIEEIANYKSAWDTRLSGTGTGHETLTSIIQSALGASPYVKQAEVLKNIDKAVETGIAYNIEQRAFLQSVKDDIAGTFNAFDSTLLQIIRVQQNDSTASRLGMEASLNAYLNQMFKNTEYLNSISDQVTGALYEATSLLTSQQSVGFEYQVQKWLGSLYSVGMSEGAISSLAQALGDLASGNISSTTSGAGKLLVMAASRGNLSYSELLTKGIDNSQINTLLESMVEYLKTIADSNKVVQTQLAAVYGLRTSDIQAVKNLSTTDITNIFGTSLDYGGGLSTLNEMARTIGQRQSAGEMMSNILENFKYTISAGIASNPVLYNIWAMSNMLDEFLGGISIPTVMAFGTGVDLNATVADLMRVSALGGSLLSGVGSLISGLGNNANGIEGVLSALGVGKGPTKVVRGGGLGTTQTTDISQMSYIGNASGSDIYEASMAGAEEKKAAELAAATKEEETNDLEDINNTTRNIYDLLASVISGDRLNIRFGDDISQFNRG